MPKGTRKKSATIPADETKSAKFVRLAQQRVGKALKAIGLIANLSSRSGYEYTADQVTKIKTALTDKVDATMSNFNPDAKSDKGSEFTF